jgi:predicted ArsR family transcriptional regulator
LRETSLEAYSYILRTGILGERRTQVYRVLWDHGPMTAQELTRKCGIPGLWKRFSELEGMGVVRQVRTRPCGVTGRKAIEWDVTAKVPRYPYDRLEDRASSKGRRLRREQEQKAQYLREQLLHIRIALLTKEVARLRADAKEPHQPTLFERG